MLARRSALALSLLVLAACGDDDGSPADAGIDAGPETPDAGGCADFSGAYGLPIGEACVRGTELELGTLCVVQDGCAATISTSLGSVDAQIEGATMRFTAGTLTCTGVVDRGAIELACADGDFSCEARATPTRSVDRACCASDTECDSGDRCAPVNLGADAPVPIVSACVREGAIDEGGACTVGGGSGTDDCGAGLTCTAGSLGDDMLVCRRLCRAAGECEAGEACRWYAFTAPPIGYCVPACTLFGDECPSYATCDGATVLDASGAIADGLACRARGTTGEGEVCHRTIDCDAGLSCRSAGAAEATCRALCDDAHPCDASERCAPQGLGDSPPSGVCVPS